MMNEEGGYDGYFMRLSC